MAQRTVFRIAANLEWQVAEDTQSGLWIGVCEDLNLNAVGKTMAEFQECANEAMAALFADLFETEELDSFLRRHGWESVEISSGRRDWKPRFDVPADIRQVPKMKDVMPAHA